MCSPRWPHLFDRSVDPKNPACSKIIGSVGGAEDTYLLAPRAAARWARPRLLGRLAKANYVIGHKGYDADAPRRLLPGLDRHLIEHAFYRLKDLRRIADRYDKLGANVLSAVALAALIAFWL